MSGEHVPAEANSTTGAAGEQTRMHRVEQRVVHEVKQFAAMFLYLFVLLGLFTLHESLVLAQHEISFTHYGFAAINALILAKVMLVAEDLRLGRRIERWRVIYSIVLKSLLFAALFICFHVIEETIVGLFDGKTIADSIPSFGGARGGLFRVAIMAIIMTFALMPYFAYTQVARAIGRDKLHAILLSRYAERGNERPEARSPPR
ncbi:MAG TPA: hypothetical protein VEJ16_02045 [Alphaproteobacteria bacterium]|nr:hypothetical protein [Alphaproteobacteria bacterium]